MAIFMAALGPQPSASPPPPRFDSAAATWPSLVLGMTARHIRSVVVVLVLALTGFGALLGGMLGIIVDARYGGR